MHSTLLNHINLIKHPDFFLFSKLSTIKKNKIIENFSLTGANEVFAFVDTSIGKNCSFGLVITEEGLHWKNYWVIPSKKYYLEWNSFNDSKITLNDNHIISFNEQLNFDAYGCLDFIDELVRLLKSIQGPNSIKMNSYDSIINVNIPEFVSLSIDKQLTILEVVGDLSFYQMTLYQIFKVPYDLVQTMYNDEDTYYKECTKQLLRQVNDTLQSHAQYKDVLLKVIAFTIEELSQQDTLWINIHQKMKSIDLALLNQPNLQ